MAGRATGGITGENEKFIFKQLLGWKRRALIAEPKCFEAETPLEYFTQELHGNREAKED